jgi:hypothetical protein
VVIAAVLTLTATSCGSSSPHKTTSAAVTPPTVRLPQAGAAPPGTGTESNGMPGPAPTPVQPPGITHTIVQAGDVCIQIPPVTVALQQGTKVPVHLKCKAAVGRTSCAGKVTLTIAGQSVSRPFSLPSRHPGSLTFILPPRAQAIAGARRSASLRAQLSLATDQPNGPPLTEPGVLTIELGGGGR